jgi:hypothetical protein
MLGNTDVAGRIRMDDVLYVAVFLVCCAVTAGLVRLCDRLRPRETGEKP